MKNIYIRQTILPLCASIIWGLAFVAQKSAATVGIGAFTFNFLRSVIATLALLAFIVIRKIINVKRGIKIEVSSRSRQKYAISLIIGGTICGILLAVAINLQQFGLSDASSGKSGFLTALYIVIVPILSIFIGKKVPLFAWVGVVFSLLGMYYLCIKDSFTLTKSDIVLMLCALFFAMHIIVVSKYTAICDGFDLSCVQFFVCAIISLIFAVLFERIDLSLVADCIPEILYLGIMSSAVGYTLQILSQRGTNPTVVTLMMSLESFFSAVFGAVIMSEIMTGREYIGCAFMLIAVVFAQLPTPKKIKKED